MLDEALTRAGHHSIVIAGAGSRVTGTLAATADSPVALDDQALLRAHSQYRAAIAAALEQWPIDVVHLHAQDFHAYLPLPGPPVLVTLHVPREWYGPEVLHIGRPNTWMHCVSAAQQRTWPPEFPLLPPVENGVPVESFENRVRKRRFLLALGRMCAEKGFHIALEAAGRAGVPLVMAGEVYQYPAHQRYFNEKIAPRLDGSQARFIGPIGPTRKRRLLGAAQCLLVPSQVPETSSLVAMEAMASGTPVVAYPAGALAEIVEHGKTGFLVHNAIEMAEAIDACRSLDPADCRRAAKDRFSASRMIQDYLRLYTSLARGG